jgi:hypothetical protein
MSMAVNDISCSNGIPHRPVDVIVGIEAAMNPDEQSSTAWPALSSEEPTTVWTSSRAGKALLRWVPRFGRR